MEENFSKPTFDDILKDVIINNIDYNRGYHKNDASNDKLFEHLKGKWIPEEEYSVDMVSLKKLEEYANFVKDFIGVTSKIRVRMVMQIENKYAAYLSFKEVGNNMNHKLDAIQIQHDFLFYEEFRRYQLFRDLVFRVRYIWHLENDIWVPIEDDLCYSGPAPESFAYAQVFCELFLGRKPYAFLNEEKEKMVNHYREMLRPEILKRIAEYRMEGKL